MSIQHIGVKVADVRAIAATWGEEIYRAFYLYLWAGCHAFKNNQLQAYSLVARRLDDPGPRPGMHKRLLHLVRGWF